MWYLYIIENRLGQLYTGITKNVEKRFAEHQSSGVKAAKALKGKGPLTLLFQISLPSHSNALKAEHWVKQRTKAEKLKLIAGSIQIPALFTHAENKNQDLTAISEN